MIRGTTAGETGRLVRLSTIGCFAGAVLAVVIASLTGHPLAGVAVAAGVVIGSLNAHATRWLVSMEVPVAATSMLRITTLTIIAVGAGMLIGFWRVWLVVLGVGVAQLVMAASALRELTRR